jgi:prepilin-type N-terminal cleavage/methylation domain-containing protein
MKRTPSENGFTMVEITVVMVIISIMFFMAIPQYRVAMEQAKVDFAATTLKSIWTAERLYWVQNQTFCADLSVLESSQMLESGFVNRVNSAGAPFNYTVIYADNNTFTAVAGSTMQSLAGQFTINEQGIVAGEVAGAHDAVITALDI